jgi:hypothetical protein
VTAALPVLSVTPSNIFSVPPADVKTPPEPSDAVGIVTDSFVRYQEIGEVPSVPSLTLTTVT